jgi:hypothetical protein
MENVKSSCFCCKINAACRAFSEIYIWSGNRKFWAKNMLLDTSISVYFQSFMEYVYHNQHLRTRCVKRMKQFLCSKGTFLDVHVVKLYASVCSVISHWIGSTVTRFCVQIMWKKYVLCCSRNFPDLHVVKLYAQGYSVICDWIYHLQTWYVAGIAWYLLIQTCVFKLKRYKYPYLWIPEIEVVESFFVFRPFVIQSFVFL